MACLEFLVVPCLGMAAPAQLAGSEGRAGPTLQEPRVVLGFSVASQLRGAGGGGSSHFTSLNLGSQSHVKMKG